MIEKLPQNRVVLRQNVQLCGERRIVPLLVDEHKNAHTADDDIAQKAVDIRQLPENHPAQQ